MPLDAHPETAGPADRAAVIGAGSMGTLIAAVLGRSMPVVLVSRREERAAQLFRWGARVEGAIEAESRPIVVRSIDDVPKAGGASLVVVATKTTAIPSVSDELRGVLGRMSSDPAGPFVVSFQNGIDPGRELMSRLSHSRVLRMVLSLGATISDGGKTVRVSLNQPPHAIGSVDPELRSECERLAATLTQGGLETRHDPDIEAAVWRKGIINAAMNPIAALVNCTVGEVLDSPSNDIVARLMREGIEVAAAEGVTLPADYESRAEALLGVSRDHVPSMVEDIRGGRESEIGQLNRQIIQRGRRLGIPTPTHDVIDALIETFDWKVYHDGAAS